MLKVQWEYQIITLYVLKVTQYYMSIIFQYIWEKKTKKKIKVQWERVFSTGSNIVRATADL